MSTTATVHELDNTFGDYPFDHFLAEKWNPESSLSQEAQERALVRTWISLGKHGRLAYIERCMKRGEILVHDHIPKDLSVFEKRKTVDPDEWGYAGAIWIRTWYGNEAEERDGPNEEIVTRASADAAYARLWQRALWPSEMREFDGKMFGPYVFDNNAAAYGVSARDADDEVELMDEIPSFILSALVRCPDVMEGGGTYDGERNARDEEELKWSQALLVVVADREACENGWVLLIALNDRGQSLYMRVRCKASDVGLQVVFWKDGGEPLDIELGTENAVYYRDSNRSGDGWDDG